MCIRDRRKAPQMIAADIAEKINSQAFEKVVATGPYVNFFLDKSAISAQVLQDVITEKEHYADPVSYTHLFLIETFLVKSSISHIS